MKILIFFFVAMATIFQLVSINAVEASTAPTGPPKLTLEGANGENHCTLDFKNAQYVFKSNNYCRNDQAIGIEFEHVPSASNILVTDDYECARGNENDTGNYFWFYLRTVKDNLSTDTPISFDKIARTTVGDIVVPGVRLMGKYQHQSHSFNKRASCVLIQVDAPPLK